ncbi:hypothetical protein Gasu2_60540 [Galdieria sulphuraria]|nr:hypothetical protein Gasu2_60540 [Galdieria sulphuraria]
MAEVAEEYDPKYEFLAPKYVNLLEAASEAALYDGADEWFDQLQSKTELVKESLVTQQEIRSKEQKSSLDTKNEGERNAGYLGQSGKELYGEVDSTTHFQEKNASEKENYSGQINAKGSVEENREKKEYPVTQKEETSPPSLSNSRDSHSSQPVDQQPHKTFPIKGNEGFSNIKHYSKSEKSILTEQLESGNRNKVQHKNKYFNGSRCDESIVTKGSRCKTANSVQHVEESKQNLSCVRKNRSVGPPAFRTEQRAFLHKERRKSSTDMNSKVNEPRTPKNFGASWKPRITIPQSPKFHSERRLRHCVERALRPEPNAKMQLVKVVRRVHGQTLTVPESPIFHTQKRADTHRALKGVPLTYEEEEMQKIQAERNALRKTIRSGRQNCAKTFNFHDLKPTKDTNQRMATIPRTFTFATQERSLQRRNSALNGTTSKTIGKVFLDNNKHVESRNTSMTLDQKLLKIPCRLPAERSVGNKPQSSVKLGSPPSTVETEKEDFSTTRKPQSISNLSRKKSSFVADPKKDVFTRLYEHGKRRTCEASPTTNKSLLTDNNRTRQPVILSGRSLPQTRPVSNVTDAKDKKVDDKRHVEHSTLRPQYAFRHNSPVHNKSRRASRVPLVENEQVVETSTKMN